LVVDDYEATCHALVKLLGYWGHSARCAHGGVEALRLLRTGRFDLVLLDMSMPDMDGLEVLRHIKTDPQLTNIHVVIYSAVDSEKTANTAYEHGAADYLVKGRASFDDIRQSLDAAG